MTTRKRPIYVPTDADDAAEDALDATEDADDATEAADEALELALDAADDADEATDEADAATEDAVAVAATLDALAATDDAEDAEALADELAAEAEVATLAAEETTDDADDITELAADVADDMILVAFWATTVESKPMSKTWDRMLTSTSTVRVMVKAGRGLYYKKTAVDQVQKTGDPTFHSLISGPKLECHPAPSPSSNKRPDQTLGAV